jgi:hypothetical protein
MEQHKLADKTIAHIAQILQIALLTGTDITDNLRMLTLVKDGEKLVPETEYMKSFEESCLTLADVGEEHAKTM